MSRWSSSCRKQLATPAVLVACIVASLAAPMPAVAGERGVGPYCDLAIPSNTDCANVGFGSWSNGLFDQNLTLANASGSPESCEHTYIQGTGTTVSRRCGKGVVSAGTELDCYLLQGTRLSGHAGNGNNGVFEIEVRGETFVETNHCV